MLVEEIVEKLVASTVYRSLNHWLGNKDDLEPDVEKP